MSLFNYFVLCFAFVSAGLAGCIRAEGPLRLVGAALGLTLAAIALAFWKLDQRSAFLVKHAEGALREIEKQVAEEEARLFHDEPEETAGSQQLPSPLWRVWTYGQTFRVLFAIAGVVGLGGCALSVYLFFS
ncbi:MAG TPA: hypothetical protein VHB79_16855 [Polyangiaceae bacterium]|nr:hypothetical protein [Polyangiaceae bacterium]